MRQLGSDFLTLPPRAGKPRSSELTHVLDKGLSLVELESLIETAGEYIDFLKLGWGTAYVSPGVRAKVAMCQEADIQVCVGGTLLEIAVLQRRTDDYVRWIHRLGLEHVEVSNGVNRMEMHKKQDLIRELSGEFRVISEVGSKDPAEAVVASRWVAEMTGDLEAGASLVIAEGRESGTVGMFEPSGKVREELAEAILDAIHIDSVIFEAPRKDQQAWFIRRLGPTVNVGNIPAGEVLSLETLRRGLRADTLEILSMAEPQEPEAVEDPRRPRVPPLRR